MYKKNKCYSEKEIITKFNKLSIEKQNKILIKALELALQHKAGTKNYAIAYCMNYKLEDDGTYTYAR